MKKPPEEALDENGNVKIGWVLDDPVQDEHSKRIADAFNESLERYAPLYEKLADA